MEAGMLKTMLTVLVTAGVCFAIAATTGLAGGRARLINVKVGDVIAQKSNNFHCQVVGKTEIACGGTKLKNSIAVYYEPHQLNVVRFNAAGTKATVLFKIAR
jgi:hypothetical protein